MLIYIMPHIEVDMVVRPQDVKSPKEHWVLIDVLVEKDDWSLALGEWDGERCLAVRWNGDAKRPKGNPVSHGMPTWFMLPRYFTDVLLGTNLIIGSDLIPEDKKDVARAFLGIASARSRWDDFFLKGPAVSDDFMRERDQPSTQEREPL